MKYNYPAHPAGVADPAHPVILPVFLYYKRSRSRFRSSFVLETFS